MIQPLSTFVVLAVAIEGPAAASPVSGFLDASIGLASPHSDGRYTQQFDTGTQTGVHGGALLELRAAGEGSDPRVLVGLDLGADHTTMSPLSKTDPPSVTRWRFTAGPRFAVQLPNVELFARVGVGVERIHLDTGGILEALCGNPTIQSAAYEGAVGIGITTHHVVLGAQFGAGVSNHRDDRPACTSLSGEPSYIDVLDTRNVDLTTLVFVGARL